MTVTDKIAATVFAGFLQVVNITLGGVTPDGHDAVNDLTYLFLEADLDVRLPQNDLIIRVNKLNPDAFVMKACEVAKTLRGKIKFVSDEIAIAAAARTTAIPSNMARNYIVTGCNSPSIAGRSSISPGGMFNIGLCLELALNDGRSRLTGEQIGPKTGDPRKFTSYEEVFDAYKKQVEALIPIHCSSQERRPDAASASSLPLRSSPASSTVPIEKGLDIGNGGTLPYARVGISPRRRTERGRFSGRHQEDRVRGQEAHHGPADHRPGQGLRGRRGGAPPLDRRLPNTATTTTTSTPS